MGLAGQAVCEMCHGSIALFRYDLFSARGSLTGNCCLNCFPNLLRATTDSAGNAMGKNQQVKGKSFSPFRGSQILRTRSLGETYRVKPERTAALFHNLALRRRFTDFSA